MADTARTARLAPAKTPVTIVQKLSAEIQSGGHLGRVCKLGLAGGRTGFSPMRHTIRLAEDLSNQLRSWTRAGPSHQSGSLQTRPSARADLPVGEDYVCGVEAELLGDRLAQLDTCGIDASRRVISAPLPARAGRD